MMFKLARIGIGSPGLRSVQRDSREKPVQPEVLQRGPGYTEFPLALFSAVVFENSARDSSEQRVGSPICGNARRRAVRNAQRQPAYRSPEEPIHAGGGRPLRIGEWVVLGFKMHYSVGSGLSTRCLT